MSASLDRLKYRDPVLRDMFTALDVSLILPLVFVAEGLQADTAKLRLAILTVVVAVASGAIIGVVIGPITGVVAAGSALGAGYLGQMGYALRRKRRAPVTSRIATWLVSTVSAVHFVTAINLIGHAELAKDFFIRGVVVAIYVIHAFAGITLAFMLGLMAPLHKAWGCYPSSYKLSQYEFGPCGESPDLPWVNPHPQSVCRQPFTAENNCEYEGEPSQLYGPAFALASHAEAVALGLYTLGCLHAYTIYFTDLSVTTLPTTSKSFLSVSPTPNKPFLM